MSEVGDQRSEIGFYFVLLRVSSWIVLNESVKENPRINTNQFQISDFRSDLCSPTFDHSIQTKVRYQRQVIRCDKCEAATMNCDIQQRQR